MSVRIIVLTIIILNIFIPSSFPQKKDFLKGLIEEAVANSPELESLRKMWEAKKAKIVSEGSLPQPQVSFMYFKQSIQTKVGPQDKKYGIKQVIPFPSKLYLKGSIATKEAEIAYTKYLLTKRAIIKEVKSLFYDYYFIIQSLRILEEERLILKNMEKTVQRKYESLKTSQQDLVKADLAISKIEDKIINLKKQQNFLNARINKILNRAKGRKIKIPKNYNFTTELVENDKDTLLDEAIKESPLIILDKLGIEEQRLRLFLAKQEYLPDFGLMADYIKIGEGTTSLPNDGEDAWMIGASVTLPLWFWKINSDIKSEKSRLESVEEIFKDKENFLIFKIEDLYFKLRANQQLIDLYQNIILPQAEQNFSTSRISYENDVVDFLNWLDAERNLIQIKIATIKQMVDYKKIIADLEYVVGKDLE
jgi:outer membrane protein TolC